MTNKVNKLEKKTHKEILESVEESKAKNTGQTNAASKKEIEEMVREEFEE